MPSNIDSVIDDVEEVKDDLRSEMRRKVGTAMRILEADARTYIEQDADWKGHLARSLSTEVTERPEGPKIVVSAGGPTAPWAPFVEFGTGPRTEDQWRGSAGPALPPDEYPPTFPYEAPSVSPGMVANIIEWVETKPVIPDQDITQEELGYRIAATIAEKGTYAHPFLRPAWFHNELKIRQAAQNAVRSATS